MALSTRALTQHQNVRMNSSQFTPVIFQVSHMPTPISPPVCVQGFGKLILREVLMCSK